MSAGEGEGLAVKEEDAALLPVQAGLLLAVEELAVKEEELPRRALALCVRGTLKKRPT